ncbi:MAG: histidine kinase [Bacteroidia bacterium]|nr:histidine kinase [Bacteroidia bacterium]
MKTKRNYFNNKYHRIELAFFITYFLIFPILSGVEYFIFEHVPPGRSIWRDTLYQLLYGITAIIPSWLCYKLIIQGLFFKKKYLQFVLMLIVYFVLLNLFKFSIDWAIAHMNFLPDELVSSATYWYKNHVFYHIISVYDLRDLVVLIALGYIQHSAQQEKLISGLKQQQLESELNFLKVQIQPHFFFNTLNNIYALTIRKSEKAAPLIAKHADIMRHILYESSKEKIKLWQEIDFLKNYTEVESMHYSDKMNISFETQGIHEKATIEPMLLLPFIENAFKHGIREETGEGYVHIIISLVENDLSVEVKNSNPQTINKNKEKGIGLQNASKRLEMLYPGKHTIEVEETDHDYELRLNLILNLHD